MISYYIKTFSEHPEIDAVHIVAAEAWQEPLMQLVQAADRDNKLKGE